MSLRILSDFQTTYSFEAGALAVTGHAAVVRFPESGHAEHFYVEFRDGHSRSWIAGFDEGNIQGMFSGVITWPDPKLACVVAAGTAWLIDVEAKTGVLLAAVPIVNAIQVESHRLVLFIGSTQIEAWDENGKRWRSRELSWDGLEITAVQKDAIIGRGFDLPPGGQPLEFWVDLRTGTSKGGADVVFETS